MERTVYEEVLPPPPPHPPGLLRLGPAGEGWSWILRTKFEVLSEEHRALARRWLGY